MYVQYGHQTEADRAADEQRREIEQQLKEMEQWQAVIVIALRNMVRGGASKQNLQQVEEASREYGERFSAIMDYASTYRLTASSKR